MDEKVKNIVAQYIKAPAAQISSQTAIDRSAVASSIILHRMYAHLANEGIVVPEYTTIKTFGQLAAGINGKENKPDLTEINTITSTIETGKANAPSIGIDTENVSAMPVVNDFREDAFYTMNFAAAEIAYCILQPDPYASFAGLFAAKEAIIKADNNYRTRTFNTIVIDHLPGGKPVHTGFSISISHTKDTAIAVAVKHNPTSAPAISLPAGTGGHPSITGFISTAAFFLALFTLILFFLKNC